MSELITVDVVAESVSTPLQPDSYDYDRLPAELRDQAMMAQGTVLTKLGGAVERVIDAGNTLRWAKQTLPHGEYLPWVQQACGLKERYAQQLVQAAEWANAQHVAGLHGITDTATLFLLSADATPEDVREWVMERCAAGEPPTRKEVQERKRQSQGKADRTLVQEVKAALRIKPEARELADKAEHITTRQLMDELNADDLPKGPEHQNSTHLFFKNGTGWWKLPGDSFQATPVQAPVVTNEIVPLARAAALMGLSSKSLSVRLSQARSGTRKPPSRNGWTATPHLTRGMCLLEKNA
nr:phage-like protein [uncultured Mediterranean phage uvMED]